MTRRLPVTRFATVVSAELAEAGLPPSEVALITVGLARDSVIRLELGFLSGVAWLIEDEPTVPLSSASFKVWRAMWLAADELEGGDA